MRGLGKDGPVWHVGSIDERIIFSQIRWEPLMLSPDRIALVFEEHEYSAARLEALANGLAGTLERRGVRAGDRVALMASNRPEWIVAVQAIWRLGASVVLFSRNAVRAIDEGRFDTEIVPIQTAHGLLSVDQHPRLVADGLLRASLPREQDMQGLDRLARGGQRGRADELGQ
jgi:non-ribosomal peptide synthetase component F